MFSLLLLLTLIGVIFFTRRLQQLLHNIPQRYWLSLGGGISLAYVFTAFLAEVTELQQHLMPLEVPVLGYLIEHIHLLMLLGIVTVYGLEGLAQSSKQEALLHPRIFSVHIGFFTLYSVILGYLLRHTVQEWLSCLLLTIALAIHLSIVCKDLFEHHPHLISAPRALAVDRIPFCRLADGAKGHFAGDSLSRQHCLCSGGFNLSSAEARATRNRRALWGIFGGCCRFW